VGHGSSSAATPSDARQILCQCWLLRQADGSLMINNQAWLLHKSARLLYNSAWPLRYAWLL
jgi:hypothetical protein